MQKFLLPVKAMVVVIFLFLVNSNAFAQTRVQFTTGNTGSAASTTISMTPLATAPVNGNTLVAIISTRGTTASRVSAITQTGATWSRATQATNASGSTTEIWYAPNVSGAGTAITITLASLRAAAVVIEYSGILTASALDAAANSTGNSTAASTGTSATTAQTNELWIGGIGLVNSGYTLGTPTNSFSAVANAASTSGTAGNNARIYALEKIVTATGAASTGGTVSSTSQWSGAIATFKKAPITSTGTGGNWSSTGTWVGGVVPATGDAVVIAGGATVTIDATTAVIGNLTVNGILDNSSNTISGSGTLTVSGTGTLLVGGAFPSFTGAKTFNAGSTVKYNGAGTQTVSVLAYSNLTLSNASAKTTTNSVTVSGILSIEGTASISGTAPAWSGTAYTLQYKTTDVRTAGTEWITSFAGSGGVIIANTAGSVTMNNAKTFNTGVPLAINSGATLNSSTYSNTFSATSVVTINGTFQTANIAGFSGATGAAIKSTNSPTITLGGSSTIEYTAAAGGQTITGRTYDNLKLDNSSLTNNAGGAITVGGTLTTTAGGTLNMVTYQLLGALTTVTNAGTIQTQCLTNPPIPTGKNWGGTVQYNALAGTQTVMAGTYNNLTLSNTSGTESASGAITVNGTLTTIVGGNLDMVTYQLLGTLTTVTNGGTIKTQCLTNTPIPTGEIWGGTVQYNALSGAQTVMAGTYNNLTLSNTSGIVSASGALTVNGTLTTTSGGTLDMVTNQLLGTLTTVTNGGTIQTQNASSTPIPTGEIWGGTIIYNGSSSQTVSSGTYSTLKINNTAGSALGGASTISTLTIGDVTPGSIFSDGGYAITTATTLNLNSSTYNCTAATFPWGTLNAGTGTVNYALANIQTVAAKTYYNLTLSGSGTKTVGSGTVAGGNLSISGTAVANLSGNANTANTLNLGVAQQIAGTWGSTTSTAANTNNTYFSGTGLVTVTCPAPATPGTITRPANECSGSTGNTYSIAAVGGAISYTWSVTGTGWSVTAGGTTNSATTTIGSGAGTVSVTATNSCGTSTAATTGSITPVTAPATPGTITRPASECSGSTGNTYSIAAVSGATSYTWSVAGTGWSVTAGGTTNSATITIGSGAGTVSVTATNGCGTSTAATTGSITPATTPATPGTITRPANECSGSTGNTYSIAAVSGATSYTWSVTGTGWSVTAGGTTNSATITIGSGAGTVSVTASNGCGTSAASATGSITPTITPATPGAITGTTPQCAGTTGQTYSISPVTYATTYTWVVPAGWSITAGQNTTSITVTAGSAGQNGNITVTAGNNCGTSAAQSLAVTSVATPATPGAITGTTPQCAGSAGQTYSISPVTYATTYTWAVPTGWSVTAGQNTTSITVTVGSAGQNGNITVTAGNTCGTSAAQSLAVTSVATPATPGAITGTTPQCEGTTSQTYSISSVTYATTYTWVVPTGWSVTAGQNTTSITVTAGSAGQNGNITVTAGNTCGTSAVQSLAVTVNANPAVPTGAATQSFCSGATVSSLAASGTAIQWYAAASGGSALVGSTALIDNTHYYASQTVSGCESATRFDVTATVIASGSWLGTTDTDWNTASNWCGGVPTPSTDVVIPSGGNQPIIAANAFCNNLTIDPGATLTISGTSSLTISGAFTNNGTFTPGSSTVIYDGVSQTIVPDTYNNLTLAGTGAKTFPAGTTSVSGILSIENGANANTFTGTLTYGANATLQYNTTSARTAATEWISPFVASGGIIIANTGTITMNSAEIFNATAPLTINSGATLDMSTFLLTLNGDLINNGGTASGTTGGVTITGTATQSIGAFTTTGAITVSKTGGTATLTGNVNAGSLAFTSANNTTLTLDIFALNLSGALSMPRPTSAAITLDVGAGSLSCTTISLGGTGFTSARSTTLSISTGTITASGDITSAGTYSYITFLNTGTLNAGGAFMSGTAGTFTAGTGTVNFNGGTQAIAPFAYTFNNVTLSGSGAKTTTNATINGILSMEGTATTTGTVVTYGTGATLQYNGAGAQTTGTEFPATWSGSGGVIIANTSGSAVTLGAAKTINGSLTINSGAILNLGTFTTHTCSSLSFAGTGQLAGTWGGTGSGATNINATYFAAATGILTVTSSSINWLGGTSTDWNTGSNWSGGVVPTASNNVIIPSGGNQPVITTTGTCHDISINAGATLTITGTLTAGGTWGNSGTVVYNGNAQTVAAVVYNNLTLAGNGSKTFSSGTTRVNGVLSIENGANTNTFTGTLTYGANATLQYNTTSSRAASTEWITPFTASGGVIIANTGVITLNAAKVFNANVQLTINLNATLISGANLLTLGGDFHNTGTLTSGSGGVTIANTAATQSIDGFTTTGTITVSKTSGTATLMGNVNGGGLSFPTSSTNCTLALNGYTLTLTGGLTMSRPAAAAVILEVGTGSLSCTTISLGGTGTTAARSTTLSISTGTVTASGNITASGIYSYLTFLNAGTLNAGGNFMSGTAGTFTAGTGTVNLNANATQTIGAYNFNNLSLSGTSAKTFSSVTTINGDLSISGTATATFSNTTNSTANTLTLGGYGQISGSWGGTGSGATYTNTVYFNATTNGMITIATGTCTNGTWIGGTSTDWNTASNWCSGIPTTTTDVVIPPGTSFQPVIGAGAAVCNNITINSGATLTITGSNTLAVSGNWTNGGTFNANTDTVTFNGTAAQTIGGTSTTAFSSLTISNTIAAILVNTNFSASGTLTVNSGSILSPAPAVIISGGGTLTGSGTVEVTKTTPTADFISQFPISTQILTNLTVDYIGAGDQIVNALNYGNLTISTNGTRTVTLAGSGTIGVAAVFAPSQTNITYTVTGSTVNFNGTGAQTINALTYYNLSTSGSGTKQLGGAISTSADLTIGSGTTLDVAASNFAISVGGIWTNNGGTLNPRAGTVTFNGTGAQSITGTAANQTFNNLVITKTAGIVALPIGATATLTVNDLTVNQGTMQINDNSSTTIRTININGNLTVQSGGLITTGTGNTIGSYSLPGTLPGVGLYHSIFHQLNLSGNFTNNGSVRFTNLAAPKYNTFAATGAVTVRFMSSADNTATLNGLTDFYNLIVDKGSDKTFTLTVNSANTANFSLYGPNLLGRVETTPFTPDNPENRKALWVKNGTLKLMGSITIPTLSEGDNANGNGDWAIGGNAQLWIAGVNVTVYTTATATTGFPEAPAGSTGVLTGSSYQAISVYGTFRISDGFFGTRNSAGFIFWDTTNATAEVFFEGGTTNTSVFREGNAAGKASYRQTGGTVIVRGDETEAGELAAYPIFDISNPSSTFLMSGGDLIFRDINTGNTNGNGFCVKSSSGNYSVTGGTITFETNSTNSPSIDLNSTSNFFNLNIKRLSGTINSIVNLMTNLVVTNNLTIYTNGTLSTGTGNFAVNVAGNFTINSGGVYTPGANTTTFDGGGNFYLWNDGTITSGLYNLVANKTLGTLIFAGTATNFNILNDLTISRDTLADGGKNLLVLGNVINSGTHKGAGKISLAKTSGSQIISGNGTGIFQNLELNNTNGASGSAQVSLAANITVTGNLALTSSRIFDISSYLLTLERVATVSGTFSSSCFILTAGAASNGGVKKTFSNISPFTYPVGTGTNYTPAILQLGSAPGTYGSVTIKPVNSQHPLATTINCFAYYWKVEESGFISIPAGSVLLLFNYGNLPDNIAYVPGVYNPAAWAYTNDITLVDEAAKTISFPARNSFVGDYTGGEPAAFGASVTYYSRQNGNWNDPNTWSTVGYGGVAASSIPGASSPVFIGDGNTNNHTVTVSANTALSGSLSLKQGSTLDLGVTSGNNFGTVVSGSNGTMRITSNGATAIFPAGDFGNFLGASGGTVEYYTTGTQDFFIPVTSATPTSATIANYYNLKITPQTGRQITMPNTDLIVYNDMTVQGASVTGLVNLNAVAAKNLSITNNLSITGGNLIFKNAFAQTLTVGASISISSGALFNVAGTGTAVNNTLSIGGSLTNNGAFDMSVGSSRLCAVTFTGTTNASISGSGSTTDFYSINVNKGTSYTPILDVTSTAFSFSNNTAPLTLTNGTFRLTRSGTVSISTSAFSIPSTTCLSSNGGDILIATAASDANDIDLGGKIEIISGSVTIGTSTNVNNNDIVYQGTGTPTIDLQGGTLFVNGQIRRNLLNGLGSLIYKQSGSSSVTINGQNSQATRAKLEVLNSGSDFEMASTSTLTIVRGAGTSFNDLYLTPTTSVVTGGTIIFGNGSTEAGANQVFSMNSAVSLNNLTIDGTTTSKTVSLASNNLTLSGNLSINGAASVFNANSLNLIIGGNLTNSNTDANTGVTTGGFRPGSTAQITTFNSSTTNQTITGASANLTNFANLAINNTNSGRTVTLSSNSALRVNNNLTLTSGIFADGGNVITVLGNISNSATHSGAGGITLAGTTIQVLSGSGSGKFGNLALNSSYDVQMTANQEITGVLTFNTKILDIGSNLLKLSNIAAGATASSSSTSYIRTNGLVTDLGILKNYPSGALSYTFPIGVTGKYTPALINVTANSAVGTVTVIPVNSKHPGTTDPLDKQLNYYWNVRKTGFSSPTVTHAYTYVASDVTGTESSYVARRYTGAIWDATGASITLGTHTANFTAISSVDGDFTAGEITEFGVVKTYYSRDATSGGNWDDVNTWSTVSHAGAVDGTYPNGQPVSIVSGHTVTTNGSSRNAYSVDLSGTLDLAGTTGHNFGVVTGAGTLKISPALSGNFVFPTGDFSSFNSAIGGTVEYNNSSGTAILPSQSTYNNILLSGNGTKQMYDTDITLNGNITNNNGSTFIASNLNNLILTGNWINNGTFTHNSGSIEFNGNTTLSGLATTTFNNLTVLSGNTLAGAASASFNVAGNWANNGTFTHNSGTVNFSGTTTISGTSTTTFNHLIIGSTLTGKLNSNIIVQGNWTNNGTFNHNGGTITFDGTTTISGTSVTSFGNVVINASRSLTAPATMNISANYTNNGTFTHNSGTVVFNGTTQTIAGTVPTLFNNLTVSSGSTTTISTTGQMIRGVLLCNGTLAANTNLTLLSDASQTALIDGSGVGDVTGNVYIKRYLSLGFGYKYFSSPFQSTTVSQLSTWVNITAPFPTVYRYDEYRASRGWISYISGTGILNPMNGYAINLGPGPSGVPIPITMNISGVVNNKTLVPLTLTNHNMTYTLGFNLIGNPYPSPIDWKAASGWIKTNVDDAIYFFNASTPSDAAANDSLQYQGIYSSYVNGVASGNADRIIPAMQGFFVHVSTVSPTDATIIFNNGIRTNDLNPVYKSDFIDYRPILRFSAAFDQMNSVPDPYVIYLDDQATMRFDGELDALKMMNTDSRIPNLYEISNKPNLLSISGIPYPVDSLITIPIGIKTLKDGWINFQANDLSKLPSEYTIYLVDKTSYMRQDLRINPKYRFYLKAGTYDQRFTLVFSLAGINKPPVAVAEKLFTISRSSTLLSVKMNLPFNTQGSLMVTNMNGQIILQKKIFEQETVEIKPSASSGVYIVTVISGRRMQSEKILIRE